MNIKETKERVDIALFLTINLYLKWKTKFNMLDILSVELINNKIYL